ncbi:hypothetical protein CWD94_14160 [Lysinibacillus xylanilyticus]|uniref:Single-stranded DNA-binding protein n=1 Tax=Lysinibacillus xylanilyticus TaxID=582475 RepID=A0A2M9Q4C6_9BACI|nr:hypothetical protein CWD94_14160 [Lysinibacillus xylanilyticus]
MLKCLFLFTSFKLIDRPPLRAVNRTFQKQQGDREADFISCQVWRKQAENLANFMKKGYLIGLEGRIQNGI